MLLLDSNIIIYAYQNEYPEIDSLISVNPICFSEISYLETIGYHKITMTEERFLQALFSKVTVLPVEFSVIKQATLLRQQRKMSLGDAIIAATAVVHNLTLVTRNIDDFKWIPELTLINPFSDD